MALGVTFAAVVEFIEERIRRRGLPVEEEVQAKKEARELRTVDPRTAPWNVGQNL